MPCARHGAARTLTSWSFPLRPGFRHALKLERIEIYASDARIIVDDGSSQTEVPRSRRIHFKGVSPEDDRVRVALSLDPDGGGLKGIALGPAGTYDIGSARPR